MRFLFLLLRFVFVGLLFYILYKILRGESLKLGFFKKQQKKPPPTHLEEMKKDPVCGIYLPESQAITYRHQGETYYFCSPQCKQKFQKLHQ